MTPPLTKGIQSPLPLSVAIVAYNEENNLHRCLSSCSDLASEIILVDAYSTDRTVEVAESFGVKVTKQRWLGHRDQKNVALRLCTQPWVLALDCDEAVSPELRQAILAFFAGPDFGRYQGAEMARKVYFMGRWITHGDWYPDRKIRLFLRERAYWGGSPEHDRIILKGVCKRLHGDLFHYSFRDSDHLINKMMHYSDVFLLRQKEQNKSWSLISNLARPAWRFARAYILRFGFLDGFPGLWIAVATSFSAFVRYSRLYENMTSGFKRSTG